MEEKLIRVLLIDDDEDDYFITKDLISDIKTYNFDLEWESDYDRALQRIKDECHDVYLVDYRLGKQSGINLLSQAMRGGCRGPFILLTGQEEFSVDLDALKAGATDYLSKAKLDTYVLQKSILYALERNKVTEALYQNEQRYRNIFEYSSDAIIITDTDLLISDSNDSADKLLGLNDVRRPLESFFSNVSDYEFLESELRAGRSVSRECELLTKAGNSTITVWLNAGPFTDSVHNTYGYQVILHDLTARKRAERELLMAEKLSMTGRIARSIAHEVRNPLTNVMLSLEQLKMELPEDNETAGLYIDIINKNCRRINQLITELLNSAKPTELNLEPNDVHQMLRETLQLAEDRIKLLNIKLETSFDEKVPPFPFDKEKLKMAFINIVINAIEAMKEGDKRLRIETRRKGQTCVVSISDNGVGIPRENIGKLFDAFFTGKQSGTGLGLTTTHNIIMTHKGNIDIESEVGKGTTFHITFQLDPVLQPVNEVAV